MIIITGLLFLAKSRSPKSFLFLSNSASYNLKAGFVAEHLSKLNSSKFVVLGSSMSLNNVNAVMLQDSFHLSAINLASWGLKLSNYKASELWDQNRIILMNMQFTDFTPTGIELKNGFNFNVSKASEMFNIFMDFKTYLNQLKFAKFIQQNTIRDYNYCQFDECGSVLLADSGFHKRLKRWTNDDYKAEKLNLAMVKAYVAELKETIASHKKNTKIIITFCPGRRPFYNKERSDMVLKFAALLKQECPSVIFINRFDADYHDNFFVDNVHYNRSGATKFTGEVIDSLKKMNVIH